MDIRFAGDWSLGQGLLLGAALATAAWLFYRRETRAAGGAVRRLLPFLRAAAVLFAVLMLTGPILHHRTVAGERGRVLVFVDGSLSMGLTDGAGPSRWKRVETLLTNGLLARLAEKHHVELIALREGDSELLWSSRQDPRPPAALSGTSAGRATNLSDGLRKRPGEGRTAVVLFSDGQHNEGSPPIQTARLLGDRSIPVYAVGMGGAAPPEDVAVIEVRGPESVFYKDRVKGEIAIHEEISPGRPFTLRIEAGGRTLWEQNLTTRKSGLRVVPFDFPVQEMVEKAIGAKDRGVEVLSLPLELRVAVAPVEGEREARNNEKTLRVRAIMHRRRALILDGRPRWEMRYLRNLFDRDEQWDVTALIADRADGDAKARWQGQGTFPEDRESLLAYDLIVFGEVPRQFLKLEELEWIRDFAERRGGGIVFIDGRRGHLGTHAELAPLMPVDWKGESPGRIAHLQLTDTGARLGALALAGETEKNRELWKSLPAPHWTAPARALPGSEVLLEAVAGERKVPALAWRRIGAGRVLYAAFDETWRWRDEVGDLHHLKYWNQVVRWVMEPPFATRDAWVSLHADRIAYEPGEAAGLRVRLRDRQGRPLSKADASAELYRDGRRVASVQLAPDENAGGMFHGRTGPLEEGRYEVRVRVAGEEMKARTEFAVEPRDAGELSALHCQEDLLRQMAAQSGGGYFREEEAAGLEARLEPVSRERVFESDTALWQSWWWFVPLVLLLTLEWILRKWAGML